MNSHRLPEVRPVLMEVTVPPVVIEYICVPPVPTRKLLAVASEIASDVNVDAGVANVDNPVRLIIAPAVVP